MSQHNRTEFEAKAGFLDMNGTITKQIRYVEGIPLSCIRIRLDDVLPQDLAEIARLLNSEANRVKEDWDEAFKMLGYDK